MSFVYILENNNGKLYIGSTVDIDRRLKQHLSGHTKSTHRMGELKVVFKQEFDTLKEARAIEMMLKKLKRRDYLKKIIKDGYLKMHS